MGPATGTAPPETRSYTPGMDDRHAQRLRSAFTAQAATIEDPALGTAFTAGLSWLVGLAEPRADDVVVDVCGGTGLVARALAPSVRSVLVVDLTPTMLATARRAAAAEGHAGIGFARADATRLPLPDGCCSLVITRFALHHVPDPGAVFDELVRVARPGGRVVVKDLVSSDEDSLAAAQDEIERRRDDSHLRMLRPGETSEALRARGCVVRAVARRELVRPLEPWLAQSMTPPERAREIRRRLRADLDGGEPTGMRPHRRDAELWFVQDWEATVATR